MLHLFITAFDFIYDLAGVEERAHDKRSSA